MDSCITTGFCEACGGVKESKVLEEGTGWGLRKGGRMKEVRRGCSRKGLKRVASVFNSIVRGSSTPFRSVSVSLAVFMFVSVPLFIIVYVLLSVSDSFPISMFVSLSFSIIVVVPL